MMIYVYSFLAIVGFVILVSIPVTIFSSWQRKKRIEKLFTGRQELTEFEFYEKYFKDQGIPFFVVSAVRKSLEEIVEVSLSPLKPDDRFFDLDVDWDTDEDLADILEEELDISLFDYKITLVETVEIETVGELMVLVWDKVQQNQKSE